MGLLYFILFYFIGKLLLGFIQVTVEYYREQKAKSPPEVVWEPPDVEYVPPVWVDYVPPEEQAKKELIRQQTQAELERLQDELSDYAILNDIITDRFYTAEADKQRSETPVTIAKYEKALKQKITSDNRIRALERKIEKCYDTIKRIA